MNIKILLLFLLPTILFYGQISGHLKQLTDPIDQSYFEIMLQEDYNTEKYAQLKEMYQQVNKVASNDELFYLALNGSTFIRINAVSSLVDRNDKRIIDLYRYYSQFTLTYYQKMGCVTNAQDMALSNIRGSVMYKIKYYEQYQYIKEKKNLELFFSKEEIEYYEKFNVKDFKSYVKAFDEIDKKWIPVRIENDDAIKEIWKNGKLQYILF